MPDWPLIPFVGLCRPGEDLSNVVVDAAWLFPVARIAERDFFEAYSVAPIRRAHKIGRASCRERV